MRSSLLQDRPDRGISSHPNKVNCSLHDVTHNDSNSRNTVISRRSALFRKKKNVPRGRQEEENFGWKQRLLIPGSRF